jgi:hypothetical protein
VGVVVAVLRQPMEQVAVLVLVDFAQEQLFL